MSDRLHAFVRWHAIVLSVSWLLATAAALYAYAVAPPTIGSSPVETVAALQGAWPWYMLCYGLFVVTDAAIALFGASLLAWLAPLGSARGLAMAVLFALAGTVGLAMDAGMLIAAQVFKSGVLLRDPSSFELVLAVVNAGTALFSAASFLLSGAASWLVGPLARRIGASPRWILFTRVLAGLQTLVSGVIVWTVISAAPTAAMLSLATGVIAMPILATLWLVGLVREVRRTRGLVVTA